MKINIESIPQYLQRYPTCGDYWFDAEGTLQIRVSELPQKSWMQLVAIHELIEVVLCEGAGIPIIDIDNFDFNYKGDSEPGDSIFAPYYKQHQFASGIERILAAELGVDWATYDRWIEENC